MMYLIHLIFNICLVFIVNHILPGIRVSDYEGVPNIGADIIFSLLVGLGNSCLVPAMRIFRIDPLLGRIIIWACSFNALAYIFPSIFDFGVSVESFFGFIFAVFIVSVGSIFSNYLYNTRYLKPPE